MSSPSVRSALAGRGLLLLPIAALGVHELRYRLAYGSRADSALAAQGHGYLDSLAPWLVLLLGLALGAFLVRVSRALAGRADTAPRRSFAALWLLSTASLVAIYAAQELLEGVFAAGHPSGLTGLFGNGGWWSLAAAVVVGAGLRGAAPSRHRGRHIGCAPCRPAPPDGSACRADPAALGSARSAGRPRLRRGRPRSTADVAAPRGAAPRVLRPVTSRKELHLRLVAGAIAVAGAAALALPGGAAAHGRGATIALDYRLRLDPASTSLPGVHVRVLDGDRALEARVDEGVKLLVRGLVHEPLLRFGDDGVWVNAASPTAATDGLVAKAGSGWVHLRDGRSLAWHDHRLAPPPASQPGVAGRFTIPVAVDGKAAAIGGTFVRVARPSVWPWVLGAVAIAVGIWAAARRRPWRAGLTIGLGVAAGLAALAAVTTFAVRAAPSGGVAWLQLVSGVVVAAAFGGLLLYLRGIRRVHAAGVVGALAAAVSVSSLPVFWHGVVVSALPASGARLACALALVCGAAAAVLSFMPEADAAPGRRAR